MRVTSWRKSWRPLGRKLACGIRTSGFTNWCLLKSSFYLMSAWETGVLSSLMIYQRDGSPIFQKDIPGLSNWQVFFFFFSVAQSNLTLYDLMDCSMPGLPVLHHLLEFAQTHVRWIDDAIQSSHPLLPPSPPAFNLSREYIFLGSLSRHNKNLGWRTLKPLGGSQLLEDRQCYSSSINQCYSSVLQLYLFR